jgi:hypothetical protein
VCDINDEYTTEFPKDLTEFKIINEINLENTKINDFQKLL